MAEKSRPKIKAAEGFAVVSDWSEHPDVKKAIASGNISAIEAATKKARDEGRNAFKPKDRAVPISELKDAYEADKAREAARLSRIEAVRENARTMNRYRQQAQTYKQQSRAREERAAGGYDATPTNRYGKPIESFLAQEPPAMPEMRPVPAMPEIPQLPTPALADRMRTPEAIDFYGRVQSAMNPYINTNLPSVSVAGLTIGSAPVMDYRYRGYPEGQLLGHNYPFSDREIGGGTPIRQSDFLNIGPYRTGYGLPVFPYYPRVI